MQVKKILLLGALCTTTFIVNAAPALKVSFNHTKAYKTTLQKSQKDDLQTGSVRGRITTSDGKVAPMVTVVLKGTRFGAVTNDEGEYHLKKVPVGNYMLIVSAIGLHSKEKQVQVTAKGTVIADFSLNENLSQLDEVQVNAHKSKYKVEKVSPSLRLQSPLIEVPQNIQTVTAKLMADQQVFDVVDGITRNVSGTTRTGHW
ncbi:MAG: carboxypeptidase-like regulatory domain-containing protein, partial [Sphingobacteriaceae bacterium]